MSEVSQFLEDNQFLLLIVLLGAIVGFFLGGNKALYVAPLVVVVGGFVLLVLVASLGGFFWRIAEGMSGRSVPISEGFGSVFVAGVPKILLLVIAAAIASLCSRFVRLLFVPTPKNDGNSDNGNPT